MTSDEFRKMALEIPTAVERSHMNHPDFRVAGKIFASLGVPDESWGMAESEAVRRLLRDEYSVLDCQAQRFAYVVVR